MSTKADRVILYASRSWKEAGTVFPSTEAQMIRLTADATAKGQIIVRQFLEEGFMGKTLRGPQLKEAFAMLERGEANVLKITRMNRVVRNVRKLWDLKDQFDKWGAKIEILEGNWDFLTANGRWMATIMAASDQRDSEIASELLSLKNRQRVVDMGLHVGHPPFGYRIRMVPDPANPDILISSGEFDVDKDAAATILKLTDWLHQHQSPAFVLDLAKEHGLTRVPVHRSSRKESNWTRGSLQYVLTNRVLTGKLKYRGEYYPGKHEPILTEEQVRLSESIFTRDKGKAGKGPSDRFPYLLGLRLWYRQETGQGVRYEQYYPYPSTKLGPDGTPYRYYRRNSAHRRHYTGTVREKGVKLPYSQIKMEFIDDTVMSHIREFTVNEQAWNRWETGIVSTANDALQRIQTLLKSLEADLKEREQKKKALRERLLDPQLGKSPRVLMELEAMLEENSQALDATELAILQAGRLGEWYKRLPVEATHVRGTFIELLRAYDKGQRRVAQGRLRDILEEPYGVVLSEQGIEIHLRPGLHLERQAAEFDLVEKEWGLYPVSPNLIALVLPQLPCGGAGTAPMWSRWWTSCGTVWHRSRGK